MNNPTSRREMLLDALAKGEECPIVPATREEMYLVEQARREANSGAFVVTFDTEDWSTFTADKTFAEVLEAYNAKKYIYALSPTGYAVYRVVLSLNTVNSDWFSFVGTEWNNSGAVCVTEYYLYDDNTARFYMTEYKLEELAGG